MRIWSIVGCVIVLGSGAIARAQTMPSETKVGALPADQMLKEMLKPSMTAASATTRPDEMETMRPGGYVAAPAGPNLLREGSVVIARGGHLKKATDGPYPQIIFNNKPSEVHLAPMLVLPNLQLMSMEDAASATKANLTFTVSGTVTEYRGKNYILLEPGPEEVNRQLPTLPVAPANPHGPASADQMLNDMLSADGRPAAAPPPKAIPPQNDLTSGPGALPPAAPVLTVLREQSQIFDRVCRLTASADGQHEEITMDSDRSTLQDPPLIVLPNLKLTALEGAAGDHHDTRFRITGVVTEYRGRNYILLQKAVVMADSDRQF